MLLNRGTQLHCKQIFIATGSEPWWGPGTAFFWQKEKGPVVLFLVNTPPNTKVWIRHRAKHHWSRFLSLLTLKLKLNFHWHLFVYKMKEVLPNTVTLAKASLEPAALWAWHRYFPACSTSALLTFNVPSPLLLPSGILPLTFDHVTRSEGVTTQKRLKEFPSLTESWDGVTSTRGGTRSKERQEENALTGQHIQAVSDSLQYCFCLLKRRKWA